MSSQEVPPPYPAVPLNSNPNSNQDLTPTPNSNAAKAIDSGAQVVGDKVAAFAACLCPPLSIFVPTLPTLASPGLPWIYTSQSLSLSPSLAQSEHLFLWRLTSAAAREGEHGEEGA